MAKIGAIASYEIFSEGKSWTNFSPQLVKKTHACDESPF